MIEWNEIKHFDRDEFDQAHLLKPELILMLDRARSIYGGPMRITSSYRSPHHHVEISKSPKAYRTHTHGEAVDIASLNGYETMMMVKALCDAGFERMGISREKKFIHVDIGNLTRELPISLWTY